MLTGIGVQKCELSALGSMPPIAVVQRINYGYNKESKPNDHCNWERELPTVNSRLAWIESDEHFKNRIKAKYVK